MRMEILVSPPTIVMMPTRATLISPSQLPNRASIVTDGEYNPTLDVNYLDQASEYKVVAQCTHSPVPTHPKGETGQLKSSTMIKSIQGSMLADNPSFTPLQS